MSGYLIVGGEAHRVSLTLRDGRYERLDGTPVDADAPATIDGKTIWVHFGGRAHEVVWNDAVSQQRAESGAAADDVARAPMPGSVIEVSVGAGDAVGAGQPMMVIESMKLQTTIGAPRDGIVGEVHVAVGQTFDRDATLVTMKD